LSHCNVSNYLLVVQSHVLLITNPTVNMIWGKNGGQTFKHNEYIIIVYMVTLLRLCQDAVKARLSDLSILDFSLS